MLWLFVILGLCIFTSAMFGFLITVRARSIQSGLHFIALFLAAAAWMMSHRVSTGWTALLIAALVELAAWFKAVTRGAEQEGVPSSLIPNTATSEPIALPTKPICTVSSIALLRTRWQATGDVFLASLRRSGQRDAQLVASGEVIRVKIGVVELELQTVGQPLPPGQLDYAFAQTFDWPEAPMRVKGHAAYINVTSRATDDVTRVDVIRQHLRAHLALAEFAPICALMWPEAGRLLAPEELQRLTRPDADLLSICVSFRTFAEADGSVVCDTAGLCAFGLMDIQIRIPGEPGDEVAKLLYRLAGEVFGYGLALVDGAKLPERFGSDFHTHYATAAHPPHRRVLELRLPTPDNDNESESE